MEATTPAASSVPRRLLDRVVVAFALWTLLANVVVLSGGTLRQLVTAAGVGAVLVLAGRVALRRRGAAASTTGARAIQLPLEVEDDSRPSAPWRFGAVAAALAIAGMYLASGSAIALWAAALGMMLVLAARELTLPGARGPAHVGGSRALPGRGWTLGLALVCAACVVVALVAHRPNFDDAVYVHIAVVAADFPDLALLTTDTLHGLDGPSAMLDLYRAQSFELLAGAVAWLTGLAAIDVAHFVFPALASALVPLAYARVLRVLVPRRWFWALVVAMLFLLCVGDTSRGFANFGFVRIQQGKAIFLSAGLPLCIAYALEFARTPTRASWLSLAACQVASIGLTSTAIWQAPAVSVMALLAVTFARRGGLRPFATGLAASGYCVALGLALRGGVDPALMSFRLEESPLFEGALSDVLGSGAIVAAVFACVLAVWGLADSALVRRVAVVFALGFLSLPWNPVASEWMAASITGASTYWRVFWLLPVPLFVGIALTAALAFERVPIGLRVGGVAVLSFGVLFVAPTTQALSAANGVALHAPGRKVDPDAFAAARGVVEHTPASGVALTPGDVGPWVPTLHGHPLLFAVRPMYAKLLASSLGEEEAERRVRLVALVSRGRLVGSRRDALVEFVRALERGEFQSVVFDAGARAADEVRDALARAGFERRGTYASFELWTAQP